MTGRSRIRWGWWLLAYTSFGLGMVGVIVPGMPTTVFILISAWAAAKGSDRLHDWLMNHPRFGPVIRDWQQHGAVSRRAKWLASITMLVCAAILVLVAPNAWAAGVPIAIMATVATWLWFRPEPPAGPSAAVAASGDSPDRGDPGR